MGAKHSTTNESDVKDDIILSTNTINDSSVNINMIVQDTLNDVSSVKHVPIVDTVGCGCTRTEKNTTTIVKCNCGSQCICIPPCECKSSKSNDNNVLADEDIKENLTLVPTRPSWSTVGEVCNRKQNTSVSTLNWVPYMFTKTDDIQDRLDRIYAQLKKIDESLNESNKRIDVLESISEKLTEYVPLTAIPYCRICKTIVLNGQVCDCGFIVE